MKYLIVKLIILFIFFVFVPAINAENTASDSASYSATRKMNHVAGPVERLFEKIGTFFKFEKQDNLDRQIELLEKRLGEVEYLVLSDQMDRLETVSSRYATAIGNTSIYMIDNKLSGKKEKVDEVFRNHQKVIDVLKTRVEYGSGLWMLLQHDYNTLEIYGSKIKDL